MFDMTPKQLAFALLCCAIAVLMISNVKVPAPVPAETYSCRDGLWHRLETVDDKQQWVPVKTRPYKKPVVCGPYGETK